MLMGFRNPGVSIYHPLRSSLNGNSLQRSHARWAPGSGVPKGEGAEAKVAVTTKALRS